MNNFFLGLIACLIIASSCFAQHQIVNLETRGKNMIGIIHSKDNKVSWHPISKATPIESNGKLNDLELPGLPPINK